MTTTDAVHDSGRTGLKREGDRRTTALVRLAIGFVQGVLLWWLFRSSGGADDAPETWPSTDPMVFGPMLLVVGYLPVVLLAGVGRLRLKTLLIWGVVAGVVLAGLALHDIARRTSEMNDPFVSFSLMAFAAAALFISHHLLVPADRQRRLIADYDGYFDAAWMAGVQLALSIGFTGAFWLMLFLGAALFRVIGLTFLGDLITESWFALPVTGLAFATAVQLTDVRDGLIRGVRTVALMLLSWLLLVLTVLVAGFLAALPFTGLEGLWETGSATALVLSAAGALIILINTAYQDGREDNLPPVVLRAAVRVAAVLLTPLIVIAVWGLMLRIGQHGLTPERIIACACALVGAVYAAGYGLGALVPFARRGSPWMKALEPTNVAAAVLSVAVILALFSPLADPARMSVADQMGRLDRGAVIDYAFLRFESGKVGEQALNRLAVSSNPEVARRAAEAKAAKSAEDIRKAPVEPAATPVLEVWPLGAALPPGFVSPVPQSDPRHNCQIAGRCVATSMDLNDDGRPEVLLAGEYEIDLFVLRADGAWESQGTYRPPGCSQDQQAGDPRIALKAGALRPVPAPWPDLSFGGVPSQLSDTFRCRRLADAAP